MEVIYNNKKYVADQEGYIYTPFVKEFHGTYETKEELRAAQKKAFKKLAIIGIPFVTFWAVIYWLLTADISDTLQILVFALVFCGIGLFILVVTIMEQLDYFKTKSSYIEIPAKKIANGVHRNSDAIDVSGTRYEFGYNGYYFRLWDARFTDNPVGEITSIWFNPERPMEIRKNLNKSFLGLYLFSSVLILVGIGLICFALIG